MNLTEDQKTGLEKIFNELNFESGIATLKGYAGTGKTTLMSYLIDMFSSQVNEIYLMAPTHKAAQVLSQKTNREVRTVHSSFGLRPVWDGEGGYKFVRSSETPTKFLYGSLVAVDEASMINSQLYDLLISAKEQYNLKLLFVGDPAQLPPVNEKPSKALDHPGHTLTKIVRQGRDNPLIGISMDVRSNPDMKFIAETNYVGSGVYVLNDVEEWIEQAIGSFITKEHQEQGDHARILAYHNETVDMYNDIVRNIIYGDNVAEYLPGEWLVAKEPWFVGDQAIIQSSEEVYILDAHESTEHGFKTWDLKVSSGPNAHNVKYLTVLHSEDKKKYDRKIDSLKKQAFKKKYLWQEYYKWKEIFAEVDYGYAMTTHKAQGSTFHSTYVDLFDLKACKQNRDRSSLIYVAATRPSDSLYILESR